MTQIKSSQDILVKMSVKKTYEKMFYLRQIPPDSLGGLINQNNIIQPQLKEILGQRKYPLGMELQLDWVLRMAVNQRGSLTPNK